MYNILKFKANLVTDTISSCLTICACLITLLVLHPRNLFAEQGQGNIDKIVKVKDNRVTVYAEDEAAFKQLTNTEVTDVLKKIEKEIGIKMTIGNGLAGKKVETDFVDLDIESALRRLLKGTYYVLNYEQDPADKDKRVLKEVKAEGNIIGKTPLNGKLNTIEIPYGKEEGEIGVHFGGEGDMSGPSCFAVDEKGNIYIPDVLKKRMLRYTAKGESLPTIPFQTGAGDIVVDKQGLIYVNVPGRHKLYQYNSQGAIVKEIDVETSHLESEGSIIYYTNDNIYLKGCDRTQKCGKFLIGKITSDGVLLKASKEETKIPLEYDVFQSGKKYKGKKRLPGFNAEEEIIYDGSGIASRVLSLPYNGVLTRELLGEDKDGNFYFQTRTVENVDRLYNIDKFSADGEYIGTAQIPGGQDIFGVSKYFLVSENGNIYGFFPGDNGLKLHVVITAGQ